MAHLEGTPEEVLCLSLNTWSRKNDDDDSEARTEGKLLKRSDNENRLVQMKIIPKWKPRRGHLGVKCHI